MVDQPFHLPENPTAEEVSHYAAQFLAELKSDGYQVILHPDGTIEALAPPSPDNDPAISTGWFFDNERDIYDHFVAEYEISREMDKARENPPEPPDPDDEFLF
jgi:hypothetical protein